jgi:DNA-binding response OmpR family regulator
MMDGTNEMSSAASRPRILVVDDDAVTARLHAAVLEREGFETLISDATDPSAVLAEQGPFDLLLLDLYMPGGGVWEVLPRLRGQWPNLAIVMLSSEDNLSVHSALLELGADDFLTKPIRPAALVAQLKGWLSERTTEHKRQTTGHDFG